MKKQLTSKDFSFIYSPQLARYIEQQGIKAITVAINPRNMNRYTMFQNCSELTNAIEKYRSQRGYESRN